MSDFMQSPVVGTIKDDRLGGGSIDELFLARQGNDVVYAGAGNDVAYGARGNDTLSGQAGTTCCTAAAPARRSPSSKGS